MMTNILVNGLPSDADDTMIEQAFHTLDDAGNADHVVTLRTQLASRSISNGRLELQLDPIRLGLEAGHTVLQLIKKNEQLRQEIVSLKAKETEKNMLNASPVLRFSSDSSIKVEDRKRTRTVMDIDNRLPKRSKKPHT